MEGKRITMSVLDLADDRAYTTLLDRLVMRISGREKNNFAESNKNC